jgi:hypothetical protein
MGNPGGGVDWDPSHTSLGTQLKNAGVGVNVLNPAQAVGQTMKDNGLGFDSDWRNSTLGQATQGNWNKVGNDVAGNFMQSINPRTLGHDMGPLTEAFSANDYISGRTQAQGRENEKQNQIAEENQRAQAAQEAAARQAAQLAAQQAADQRNRDYLGSQASAQASQADEDAFLAARNAARRARGNPIFGAYNG